jgi:LPS sulfotransferase NodH
VTPPRVSYFVCGTPRNGGSLLCGLLKSTGVAGRPEEYFVREFQSYWSERWGTEPAAYLRGMVEEATTANGVFGAKLMWPHVSELLRKLPGRRPVRARGQAARIERAFPNTRYVWLSRDDRLAQAISLSKAMQTGDWTAGEERAPWAPPRPSSTDAPRFDFKDIRRYMKQVTRDDEAWRRWFSANGIQPFRVRYEDLAEDMEGMTRAVLAFLDVELPDDATIEPQHARQADAVNDEWARLYRSAAGGGDPAG